MPASKVARCFSALILSLAGTSVLAQDHSQVPVAPATARSAVPRLVKFTGHVGQTSRSVPDSAAEAEAGTLRAPKPLRATTSVTFAIYAEQEGGAALWQETQNVVLDAEGRYSVLLGAASRDGMPAELFATGEPRWLGVRVNVTGDADASGEQARVLLVSVPYALRAADAEMLGGRAATDFVLREELAGWSGVAAGVAPGAADRPRAVGGSQGVVNAIGAVNFMPRVTAINSPAPGDVAYGDSQIFDDGTNIRIGNPAVGTALVTVELTTPNARNAFNSTLRFENTAPIVGSVVSAMNLTLADRTQASNESKQAARFTYLRNVIATGGVTNFDSIMTTTAFINSNAPYVLRGVNMEFPRVAPGITLGTYYGLFLEAPLGGGGTITNAFALVTAPGSGNVGIGTTTPAHLLDVAGDARVTGAIRAGQYLDLAGNPVVGSGDITDVIAGAGLSGGATTGAATLSLDTAFTDARYLQLTGGTLTGAFNGTTGAFSGALTATSGTFSGTVSGPTGSFSSRLIARGTLEAAALGSATPTVGFNSASQVFFYSVHNGTSNLTQDFRWIATPVGNGAPAPTGRLKLQWGNGVSLAGDTGLSISNAGIITFASGQTFPGAGGGGDITDVITLAGSGLQGGATTGAATLSLLQGCFSGQILKWDGVNWGCANDDIAAGGGGGDITDVIAGAGLTGGSASGAATLSVDSSLVPFLNASNNFSANQTITGDLTLSGAINGGFRVLSTGSTPNILGGFSGNTITGGVAGGVLVGGGAGSCFGLGQPSNRVTDDFGVVGGGCGNQAGDNAGGASDGHELATVAGGFDNTASGQAGAVGGGQHNTADGYSSIVPGGYFNTATGFTSFAAGLRARALHDGAFVWGDSTDADIASTAANQFVVRAAGGLHLFSGSTAVFRADGTGAVRASSYLDFATGKNVGLLLTCLTDQVMKWNGTDWVCDNDATGGGGPGTGDITDVLTPPGSGLLGGASSGSVSLNLDTAFTDARYAQLAALNTFTTGQTISLSGGGAALTAQSGATTGVIVATTSTGSGPAIRGIGSSGLGVVGETAGLNGIGVAGGASGSNGVGVEGTAETTATTDVPVGVRGVAKSTTGVAGDFHNTASGKILSLRAGAGSGAEVARVDGGGGVFGSGFFDIFTSTLLSLRTDCGVGQIMKWNGTTWQCDNDAGGGGGGTGDITSVLPGQGLTGGATTGDATLSLDTSFTDSRYLMLTGGTLTGALTGTTGAFSGSNSSQILSAIQTSSGAALLGTTGTTSGAIAVKAVAGSAVGTNYGVHATTAGTAAEGVHGEATSFGGPTIGVRGLSASTIGVGVRGDATDSSGSGTGVLGTAAGSFGGATGVRGQATATSGVAFGVYGTVASTASNAIGVRGEATGASGVNFGVRGVSASNSGIGVEGDTSATSGSPVGVSGIARSVTGMAGRFENTAGGTILLGRGAGATNQFLVSGTGQVQANSYLDLTTAKNVGLLLTCSSNQVMQWNGTDWVCATVSGGSGDLTDLLAGTGISVTDSAGPQPTVSIDPAVVPRLTTANAFTGNQTVTGNVSVTGTGFFTGNTAGPFALVRGVQSGSAPALAGSGTSVGVSGQATAATGVGVQGSASSTNGIGVQGTASAASGVAVDGNATGSGSIGVRGTGIDTGLQGTAGATGVRGTGTGNFSGVYGVFGEVTTVGNGSFAVYGLNNNGGPSSTGVTGSSPLGNGVWGNSGTGFGVPFNFRIGVYASSDGASGFGVYSQVNGASGTAIFGHSLGSPGGVAGLFQKETTGDIIIGRSAGGANQFRVDTAGQVFASNYLFGGADFAESIEPAGAKEDYEPGDVLVISPSKKRTIAHAAEPYSRRVAGIYSTKPGLLGSPYHMGDDPRMAQEIPVAIVGIVPCKVSAENGAIEIGDLLVTSSTLAHAMKGTDFSRMLGAVVGKALQPFTPPAGPDGKPIKNATAVIEVLVTLQ